MKFRNVLERNAPRIVVGLFLVCVGVAVVSTIKTGQSPPSIQEMLPQFDWHDLPWSIPMWILFALLPLGTLPELATLLTVKQTIASAACAIGQCISWMLMWMLYVLAYMLIIVIYANLVWLAGVL